MLTRTSRHVRLAPESRRIAVIAKPPLRATSALMQRSNEVLFDHLVGECKHDFTQSSAESGSDIGFPLDFSQRIPPKTKFCNTN